MDFFRQQPWTEDEIRHRILELQRQVEKCRKQLEIAQCELGLLTEQLSTSQGLHRGKSTMLAGRLAGV
jgi:hypothetical protein